jgi:hypothetical protein
MPVPLSEGTEQRLALLFEGKGASDARALLVDACAENLPFMDGATPEGLERIRYACLRLSGGHVTRLRHAVREAQMDWRDVLMAAGFGEDEHAHASWWPASTR